MWRDEKPAAPQWVVPSMRDVVEDFFGHFGGGTELAEAEKIN